MLGTVKGLLMFWNMGDLKFTIPQGEIRTESSVSGDGRSRGGRARSISAAGAGGPPGRRLHGPQSATAGGRRCAGGCAAAALALLTASPDMARSRVEALALRIGHLERYRVSLSSAPAKRVASLMGT